MGQSQYFQKTTQKKSKKNRAIKKRRSLRRGMGLFPLIRNQGVGCVKNMKTQKKTCKNSNIVQAMS